MAMNDMHSQYFQYEYTKIEFNPCKYSDMPIIVGIDPDVDKSGIAVVDGNTGKVIDLLNLCEKNYLDFLATYRNQINKVVFSAGWLNKKTNFHRKDGERVGVSEKKALNVGLNHQVGITLMRLTYSTFGLPIQQLQPNSAKIKDRAKFAKFTGWKGKSNQETRDAAILIVGMYAKAHLQNLNMLEVGK